MGRRRAGSPGLGLIGLLGLILLPSAAAARDWSPALHDAWRVYYAEDYAEAARMCIHIGTGTNDARTRRDAAALHALCLLRMDSRSDRIDGRARLLQLGDEDPTLLEAPECSLAYGLAQTALYETASALEALDAAARGFAAEERTERQLAALVALARAWAVHSEWEITARQSGEPRPVGADETLDTRRARIADVRDRIAALAGSEDALAQVDVVLAELLLDHPETTHEGVEILLRLAQAPRLTTARAQAALRLAEVFESGGAEADAVRWYERVAADGPDPLARTADARLRALTDPRIELESPRAVRTGDAATIALRVRNLPAVTVEVRQTDLSAWLEQSGRRGNEAFLSTAGSVRLARQVETTSGGPYRWWDSAELDAPLEFSGDAGAYVVVARAHTGSGREVSVKRLLLVSDLAAITAVGAEHVAVWAAARPGAARPDAPQARFWMKRSFRATEATFADGVARFALPAEARIMRDREWVCVVSAGPHHAVCRGRLPAGPSGDGPRTVTMLGGPDTVATGDSFHVSGWLPPGPIAAGAEDVVEIILQDDGGRAVDTRKVPPSPDGAFSARFTIDRAHSGRHFRVVAHQRGRALENTLGPVTFNVPSDDVARFRVDIDVPDRVAPGEPIRGVLHARYPWGVAPRRCSVFLQSTVYALPQSGPVAELRTVGGTADRARFDAGNHTFVIPADRLGASDLPRTARIGATVRSWDGRVGRASAEVLLAPTPAHAWLTHDPAEPHVGVPLRFRAGWFEPGGRAVIELPDVEILTPSGGATELELHPDRDGLTSDPWVPAEPGVHGARTVVPALGGVPLVAESRFSVHGTGAAAAHPSDPPPPYCRAHWTGSTEAPAIEVEVVSDHAGTALLLTGHDDVLDARAIALHAPRSTHRVPIARRAADVSVYAVVLADEGPRLLTGAPVQEPTTDRDRIQLHVEPETLWPGMTATVRLSPRDLQAGRATDTVVARLIPAVHTGYIPRETGEESTTSAPLVVIGSGGDASVPLDTPRLSATAQLPAAVLEGATLWTWAGHRAQFDNLAIPLPDTPALFTLRAAVRDAGGRWREGAAVLDARRGVHVALDVPDRMRLGDRSLLAVRLDNGSAHETPTTVELVTGAGLALDAVETWQPGFPHRPVSVNERVEVVLPPRGQVWILGDVEARAPGPAQARVIVRTAESEEISSADYRVQPAPQAGATADASIRVQRRVQVWRAPDEGRPAASPQGAEGPVLTPGEDEDRFGAPSRRATIETSTDAPDEHGHHHADRHWAWVDVDPQDRLMPGEFLLVTEQVIIGAAQRAELAWTQWMPATCDAITLTVDEYPALGQPRDARADRLRYIVPPLASGTHVHHYLLSAVRPGDCALPTPAVQLGGQNLTVTVDPAETRLLVGRGR